MWTKFDFLNQQYYFQWTIQSSVPPKLSFIKMQQIFQCENIVKKQSFFAKQKNRKKIPPPPKKKQQ